MANVLLIITKDKQPEKTMFAVRVVDLFDGHCKYSGIEPQTVKYHTRGTLKFRKELQIIYSNHEGGAMTGRGEGNERCGFTEAYVTVLNIEQPAVIHYF